MSNQDVQKTLWTAIVEGDEAKAVTIAQEFGENLPDLLAGVDVAIDAIKDVGARFGAGDCYLPEMMLAAETMLAFMRIVTPKIEQRTGQTRGRGKVLLCTVKGDIHTIGKDIVGTMLAASGFEVIDLGVDVSPMDVIKAVEQSGARIVGLSALMTTSMPYQKETIVLLKELGIRDRVKVVVGGGPVTAEYARQIEADGWAPDAAVGVTVCEQLVGADQAASAGRLS